MKKNTKALLASALIFPGLGQYFLKRYKSSVFFIGFSIACLTYILIDVMSKAMIIANKVVAGEVEADLFVIRELVAQQQAESNSYGVLIASVSLGLIWLVSIIDVYRLKNTCGYKNNN